MPDPMHSPSMLGSRDFRLDCPQPALTHRLSHAACIRAWFLRTPAGSSEGEAGVAAAYSSYRKSYAQQALNAFFRHHSREEWLQRRHVFFLAPCAYFSYLWFFRYEPSSLVAAFQESREVSLQRLKAWKRWRQDGGVVSYAHDSCAAGDEPLCAESSQQYQCSVTNSIIFIPNVPASVSRAALQSAFGSLAGLNELIPGPVRADLVRHSLHSRQILGKMLMCILIVSIRGLLVVCGFIFRPLLLLPPPHLS